MSYLDAENDNILIKKDSNGYTWYYPKCWICGTAVPSWNYISGTKYTCQDCRKLMANAKMDMATDKKQKKLEIAIKRISKVTDVSKYKDAIKIISEKLYTPRWFQSTEEIMVALELNRREIPAYHQVKVYDYFLDFVIPKFKVILEIDGKPFHSYKNEKEVSMRDEVIACKFGDGWQVIHIDTDAINMNVTKLIPAIKAVLNYRKRHGSSL